MRLQRYLASVTLLRAGGALLLVCLVYVSVDLVEARSMAAVPARDLLAAYPFKLPEVVGQMLPLALLFGVLLALSSLRRGGEWEALRSAGLSPLQLGLGLLLVPLAGVALSVPLVGWLGPAGSARFASAVGLEAAGDAVRAPWTVRADGALVRAGRDRAGRVVIERDPDGQVSSYRLAGDRIWRRGQGWSIERSPAVGRDERVPETSPSGADAALRLALIAASALVPLLGLLLALGWEEGRATRLVALGLAVGAAYWLVLAAAWNGAVLGAWSALWVSVGVPVLFCVLSLLAGIRVARAATPLR